MTKSQRFGLFVVDENQLIFLCLNFRDYAIIYGFVGGAEDRHNNYGHNLWFTAP